MTRRIAQLWPRIGLVLCLAWVLAAAPATTLFAQTDGGQGEAAQQDPSPPPPPPAASDTGEDDALLELDQAFSDRPNCPPSTMTKILVGVIGLALLTVCYFLIVHLAERRYIQQDRSASLGRHVGFSWSIAIAGLGTLGAYLGLTKCPFAHWWPFLLVGAGIWIVHLLYVVVVVRHD